jgi:hypothetical protein
LGFLPIFCKRFSNKQLFMKIKFKNIYK